MIQRLALGIAVATLTSSCAVLGLAGACEGLEIIGEFEQVGDLVENANVQSSDVQIGGIHKIELNGWEARVTMCLQEDEKIPEDVQAVVRTTSLLGEKFIDLKPQTEGPPYLEDGDVITIDQTSKATELEDVFAKLASILGTGNLEQINRFTASQAQILRDNAGGLRDVLRKLSEFTGVLADRKEEIASAVDSLDSVATTLLADSPVLESFLRSFADSSEVLANQKAGLRSLLLSLDRFTQISIQLLRQTESGLNRQFADLRPILRTVVANSANLRRGLETLATFAQWFPETMPGDYLQLDVCQAGEDDFNQGTDCPQAIPNDDPDQANARDAYRINETAPSSAIELILRAPLRGGRR